MKLDRWIALGLIAIFLAYGYSAWFLMDDLLPPILRVNPVWPSSFPKILSISGIIIAIVVVLDLGKAQAAEAGDNLDIRKWRSYNSGQAVSLLVLMVAYALLLRGLGFIAATALFLAIGSWVLGERRKFIIAATSITAAFCVWYLVDSILGIYMKPLPQLPSFLQ